VFATILLNRVSEELLSQRRTEQSGFIPDRSTVDSNNVEHHHATQE